MASSAYDKYDRPESDFSDSDTSTDARAHRTSEDLRRHDRETLTAEEEAERLLGERKEKDDGNREAKERGARRQRRKAGKRTGEKELVYEMEEGGPRSSSAESSGHSSEVDMRRLGEMQARRGKASKASGFAKFTAVHVVIVAAFLSLLYGAYRATGHHDHRPPPAHVAQHLSNGTHMFAPTTILISLDGFRADFLARNLTPTLNSFIREGVSPRYMTPSFPSLTFPNHFTLVTGLYPESHGVVGNTFWDPDLQKEFYYTDPDRSMQPEWWKAEPIWLTAEVQGVRTAIHMWPGSEAHIGSLEPAYVDEFNGDEKLEKKVDRIFHWLDLPGSEDVGAKAEEPRPQLIAAYVPNVDADGHKYGPNSTYIRSTIEEVDSMLGDVFKGIDERNLTDIVNIIVVSDHGMATTSTSRLLQLEDLVDTSAIEHTDGWPLYGLRPYDNSDANISKLYNGLLGMADLPKYRGSFDVYLRDKTMPPRFHFHDNARIAPLWIVPRAGWAIVTKDEFNVEEGRKQDLVYHPRGLHGYDHEHPLMRAIFVARGPAFPHPKGSRVAEFQNTEVYNIVCDSIGIEPVANNGTLRLPLRTQGTHDFDHIEVPHDPQDEYEVPDVADRPAELSLATPPGGFPTLPVESKLPPIPPLQPIAPGVEGGKEDAPKRPVVHDGVHDGDGEAEGLDSWWEWVKGKLDAVKAWAKEHGIGSSSKSQHHDQGKGEKGRKGGAR